MEAVTGAGVCCRRAFAGFALNLLAPVVLLTSAPVAARPVNIEFRFTPYRPAVGASDSVTTLEGDVVLEVNGVPMLELPLKENSVMVMPRGDSGPEVSSTFFVDALGLQPLVRRGENRLRLRFTPKDGAVPYRSQFRWAVIEDQTTTSTTQRGSTLVTNYGAEGREDREARGPVTVQQTFSAPFAKVEPWHAAPAVTTLTPADRAAIREQIRRRAALFSPDFAAAYRQLASMPMDQGIRLDVAEARRQRCLEAGYAAGMRVAPPADADLRLVTTDSPVVVARGPGGFLLTFPDLPGTAARQQALPNDQGFCLAIAFNMLFPRQMLLVKGVDGQWQILL